MGKKGILIQARLSSSRFPGKMLKSLGEVPLVQYVFNRCEISSQADLVGVITSFEKSDDLLYDYCKKAGIPVFRGSLDNVLDRYIQAAKYFECDIVCRVCGDSPFVDIFCIDKLFRAIRDSEDYLSVEGRLKGFIFEVVTLKALLKVQCLTNSVDDLEHVTKYIRNNLEIFNYRTFDMKSMDRKLQDITLTIDYKKDLELANSIIAKGLRGYNFMSKDVIDILYTHYNELKKMIE